MPTYSGAHEKEELRYINAGIRRSVYALLLCWLPLIGQALAISAFMKEAVRLTARYKKRLCVGVILSVLSVIVSLGALLGEIYVYTQKPDIVSELKSRVWSLIVSDSDDAGGEDDDAYGGLGLFDDGTATDFGDAGAEYEEDLTVPDEYFTDDGTGDADFVYDPADEYTGELTDDEYQYDFDYEEPLSTEAPDPELRKQIFDEFNAGLGLEP